jgi:hypothetical protein
MSKALAVLAASLAVPLCAILGILLGPAPAASAADCVLSAANVCDLLPTPTTTEVVPTTPTVPPVHVCAPVNSDRTYCEHHRGDGVTSHGCRNYQHWDPDLRRCVRNVPLPTTITTSPPSTTINNYPSTTQVTITPKGGAETGNGDDGSAVVE